MRYAVISDVHSNLEALEAVLNSIRDGNADEPVREIICLGDVVGYNASPNECIDVMRERGVRTVMGNHDSRAAGLQDAQRFNELAREAIQWTRDALTEEHRLFLKDLPPTIEVKKSFLAVHGWINSADNYIFSENDAGSNFALMTEGGHPPIAFFGHTHVSAAYVETRGAVRQVKKTDRLGMEKGGRYLINPGAVGQSRDGDPRAAYLIYDTDGREVTFHRVEYDVDAAMKRIFDAGLPVRLAERLEMGR